MAFILGLVAAAATRALSSDDKSNPGHNGNDQHYDNYNNRRYNNAPRAASAVGRRADRRADRIASRASDAATVMSLVGSGSRSRSAAPALSQPAPPYTDFHEAPAPREVRYYSSEAQGPMAGSYRDSMPVGAPEGYRWRDEQSYNRPVSQRGRDRALGAGAGLSVNDLPPYEQVVQRPRKP